MIEVFVAIGCVLSWFLILSDAQKDKDQDEQTEKQCYECINKNELEERRKKLDPERIRK